MGPTLQSITAQYPVLSCLSSWVSTLDLFHLSLASKHFYDHILASKPVFDHLKRTALCDGRGLKRRQNFEPPYRLATGTKFGKEQKCWTDEPIEVRLWALECDEAGALPCRKCGINICEECRRYKREPSERSHNNRRPHLNSSYQNENLFCLCGACDSKLEEQLRGQFLNELCDCDIPKRWICSTCAKEEQQETNALYAAHTVSETDDFDRWDELADVSKNMMDHQFNIVFLCHCGAYVPNEARPRCTWCKRKHRPEGEWRAEMKELMAKPDAFEDPCYPPFTGSRYDDQRGKPYPKLAYDGPIWQTP